MKILKDEQKIDWLYGGEEYKITKKEIEALLKGKKLYGTINDEYAFTIELEGVDNVRIMGKKETN